ncbi:uncharacterized protein PAC_02724 [Phialocephala subalpina]|uniref:C2H2-type domain-containing protein n=1 Tax=Phialocephala subalpina TaxID=576137 RepID=A0A1L7WJ93_9HELO|nr:uncharacterized protein PAC_02724 [Phialocephala subalpina]
MTATVTGVPTSPQAFPVSQPLPQYLDDLVNGLSLQDATNDHPIIPLTRGRQLSTFRVGNPRLNFLKPRFAGVHANPFAAETTTAARQPKNEKASGKKRTHGRKRNSSTRATGSAGLKINLSPSIPKTNPFLKTLLRPSPILHRSKIHLLPRDMAGCKEGQMAVTCTCNKRFKSESDMAKHLRESSKHALESPTPPPPPPHSPTLPLDIQKACSLPLLPPLLPALPPPSISPPAPATNAQLAKALKDFEKLLERLSLPVQEPSERCGIFPSSFQDTARDLLPSNEPFASTSGPEAAEEAIPVGDNAQATEESKKYWDVRKKANISTRELNKVVEEEREFEVVTEWEKETDMAIVEEDWALCERDCKCCEDCCAGNL